MNIWTIQYKDATGATQEYGFSTFAAFEGGKVIGTGWTATFKSQRASTVQLSLPGIPPHLAPIIPFESRVTIWSGREGSPGAYAGGTKQFQGLRTDRNGTADPSRTGCRYQFEDEWYFLENCPYYQQWTRVVDNTPGAEVTTTIPLMNVILFQPNPGQVYVPAAVDGMITTGQQIKDVLTWAITMGANLQVGTIDPSFYCAVYPIQNVKCADAIRHCLRLHPDCFTEIDYSTTPPTFNIRKRANLTAITLPYSYTDGAGRRHMATDIQARPELQAKRIGLFYRIITNGYLSGTQVDIYPKQNLSVTGPVYAGQLVGGAAAPYTAGGTPIVGTAMDQITTATTATIPVGNPPGLRALDFGIDIQGPRSVLVTAKVTSNAFNAADLTWWQKKVPSLVTGIPTSGAGALAFVSGAINGGGAKDITVVDETGTAVDLATFAYELDPKSSVTGWMTGVQVKDVKATAYFTYQKTTLIGNTPVTTEVKEHAHAIRLKLINVPTKLYQFTQYLTSGEAIPPNLAQNIYEALNTLQYNLTHRLVERPFTSWLKPGLHAINLDGGAAAWETMAATVQQTSYRMHLDSAGETFDFAEIKCGPVEHLEAGQLVQLFNVFTNRDLGKVDANERNTGLPLQGQTVDMPDDAARENSIPAPALPVTSQHAYTDGSGNFFGIRLSAKDMSVSAGLNI